jgi:hypothetical protein
MVSPDDLANALRLPDGSLIMDRADGDDELDADAQQLGDAGWQVISRCERPGLPTVITWAKAPQDSSADRIRGGVVGPWRSRDG